MKVLMTGGGSGGHITPLLAVAAELKKLDSSIRVVYIGQRGDSLLDIPADNKNIDTVHSIRAGKLRRYANEGWRQLFDVKSQSLNARDITRTIRGFGQALRILRRERPDIVFCKGGFVGVPVGLAAAMLHIPYITHDSDSTPGLANRLIARWAAKHAVALAAELYPYPRIKTITVGIPVDSQYARVGIAEKAAFRAELGMSDRDRVVLVTGGGNGARALNECIVANARYLLAAFPNLRLIHIAGRALVDETNKGYDMLRLGNGRQRVYVMGFVSNLYAYSGAADVIVARGSATSLAEFALQHKACVLVPSKQLAWNIKNAAVLQREGAVEVLDEDQAAQPERLGRTVAALLHDASYAVKLGAKLAECAGHAGAARDLAILLIDTAHSHSRQSKPALRKT